MLCPLAQPGEPSVSAAQSSTQHTELITSLLRSKRDLDHRRSFIRSKQSSSNQRNKNLCWGYKFSKEKIKFICDSIKYNKTKKLRRQKDSYTRNYRM